MRIKNIRWDWATAAALMMACIAWAFKIERNTARTATGVEYFNIAVEKVVATQEKFQDALDNVRATGTRNTQHLKGVDGRLDGVDRRLDDHQRQFEQFRGWKP